MQCNAMQCSAMQCNAMQCNAMQCNAMQYNTIQYNAIQQKLSTLTDAETNNLMPKALISKLRIVSNAGVYIAFPFP